MITHHPYVRSENGCAVCGKGALSAFHFGQQDGKAGPPPYAKTRWTETMPAVIKGRSTWIYR